MRRESIPLKKGGSEREESTGRVEPTKQRILRVAAEVFATQGFGGSTTRDIAAGAGINVSTLHYHWDSKENLYLAVIEEVCKGLVEIGEQWEARAGVEDLNDVETQRSVVREAVGELIEYALDNQIFARLMAQKWSKATLPMEVETRILLPAAASISRALKRAFERGLGRTIDAELLTLDFIWLFMGYLVGEPLFKAFVGKGLDDPTALARLKEHITELALRIIGL